MVEKKAKKNDKVVVEYTGKLETGELFDSSKAHGPLEFEIGAGQVIKGFEEGVIGMKINEEKEIKIEPQHGYGLRQESYVKELSKNTIPKEIDLREGMILMFKTPNDKQLPCVIKQIKADVVIVDFNHPLAGRKLIFEVKLVEIK